MLALVDGDGPVLLEIREAPASPPPTAPEPPLTQRILHNLRAGQPLRHDDLRTRLRVRGQHLTVALRELETSGQISRTANGWIAES